MTNYQCSRREPSKHVNALLGTDTLTGWHAEGETTIKARELANEIPRHKPKTLYKLTHHHICTQFCKQFYKPNKKQSWENENK